MLCLIGQPCDCTTCQSRRVLQFVVNAAFHRRTSRRVDRLSAIHPLESRGRLIARLVRRVENQVNHFARN